MSVKVGTLVIDLTANTASFSGSMEKMEHLTAKTAAGVKRSLQTIAAVGLAMGAAIATGSIAAINGALESADAMAKLAQSAGTTVETLTTLNYAAGLSNVSTEQLGVGLVKLSKNAFAAQNGNDGLARTFKKLGVDVDDGNGHLKDSGELLGELSVKFAGMQDGAGKSALAVALLGKSGAMMIPMLNQYGSEQAKVNAEAKRFGQILSTDAANAAGDVKDNFERLQKLTTGFGNGLLASVLPALGDLSKRLLAIADAADIPELGKSFGVSVAEGIRKTGDAIGWMARNAGLLKNALEALVAVQAAKIAIPLLANLNAKSLAAGVGGLTVDLLGLGKAGPVLINFGKWVAGITSTLASLAATEGIAATAALALESALAFIATPVTVVVAAIAELTSVIYKFREATRHDIGAGLVAALRSGGSLGAFITELERGRQARENASNDATMTGALRRLNAPPSLPDDFKSLSKLGAPRTDDFGPPSHTLSDAKAKLDLAIASQERYLANLDATPEMLLEITAAERADAEVLQLRNQLLSEGKKLGWLDEAYIRGRIQTEEALKALNAYGSSLVNSTRNADLSTDASNRLTTAMYAGDAASRRATVENEIAGMQAGKTASQIAAMAAETDKYRAARMRQLETEASNNFSKAVDDEARAAELAARQARNLADAQEQGEGAVRAAIAANALLGLSYRNVTGQMSAETREVLESIRVYNAQITAAQRAGQAREETRGMREDLGSRAGLPAAILQGEDVYRRAALAARLYGINLRINQEADAQARDALIQQRQAMIDLTNAEHDEADVRAALALLSPVERYREEAAALDREIVALEKYGKGQLTAGRALVVAATRQEQFNRALEAQVDLLTRLGTARDGVNAFFLSMQRSAKSTASIVYDALTSAFDGVAHNLAQLVTGGQTNFGDMLKGIGRGVLESVIRNQMQSGLKKLGSVLGIPGLGGAQYDGQSATSAFWVQFAGMTGPLSNPLAGIIPSLPAAAGAGKAAGAGGFLSDLLGGLFGGLFGKGGGSESVISTIDYGGARAFGGPVSPSSAYLVGENGPEILYGASGRIASNADSRQMMGGATSHVYYQIDARGSKDPHLTEQNVRRALVATHQSAVVTAMQAAAERSRRTL